MSPEIIKINLDTIIAIGVVLGGLSSGILWIGSKFFATRRDFHRLHNNLTEMNLSFAILKTDVSWIKKNLGGEDE